MADNIAKPVVSDDMMAGLLAAIKRAEAVPAINTLIDEIDDEEWLSNDPDGWNINAGSDEGEGEIDSLDEIQAA